MSRNAQLISFVSAAFVGLALATPQAQQTTAATHAQHLDAKGKQVMGFDQDKTTHHFLLYDDGGAIDVGVKDKADKPNLDAIRSHLPHIAMLFSQGNFESPMLVHDTKDVPGTKDMARLKDKLKFAYGDAGRRTREHRHDRQGRAGGGARVPQVPDRGPQNGRPDDRRQAEGAMIFGCPVAPSTSR